MELLKLVESYDELSGLEGYKRLNEPPLGRESIVHSIRVSHDKKQISFSWSDSLCDLFNELRATARKKELQVVVNPVYIKRLDYSGGMQCYFKPKIELQSGGKVIEKLDTFSHWVHYIKLNRTGSSFVNMSTLKSLDVGVILFEIKSWFKGLRNQKPINVENPIEYFDFADADWCAETNPNVILGATGKVINMKPVSDLELRALRKVNDINKEVFKNYYCYLGERNVTVNGENVSKNIWCKKTRPRKWIIADADYKVRIGRGEYADMSKGSIIFESGLGVVPLDMEEWEHNFTPLFSRKEEAAKSETVMLRRHKEATNHKHILNWARVPRLEDSLKEGGFKETISYIKDQAWTNIETLVVIPIKEIAAKMKADSESKG